MKRVCINCAHLTIKEEVDEHNIFSVRRGNFVCGFYKDKARVTHPWQQTCGDNYIDKKTMNRDNILNEILNEG